MGGVSLLDGWLPVVLFSLGTLGAGFLLARPERWWWLYYVPATLVVSTAAAWYFATTTAEDLFAEELPFAIAVWAGAVVASVLLAIGHFFRTPWWDKIVAVLAAVFVIALGVNQINRNYQQYPTVADLFGASGNLIAGPPPVDGSTTPTLPSGPLTEVWTPTGSNIPTDGGQTSEISLPGTTSGFDARDGYVYYPPAYFADNPQPLPVLILIAGQPGDPGDWFLGNRTQGIMDAFAAQHNGIAPVVVTADALGSQLANPLCTNSSLGQVGTYLSQDVPAAIKSQLRVDPDPKHWVFGGFSYGGTCALQMATNHPDEFPNFVDISGEREPTLGTHGADGHHGVRWRRGGLRRDQPEGHHGQQAVPEHVGLVHRRIRGRRLQGAAAGDVLGGPGGRDGRAVLGEPRFGARLDDRRQRARARDAVDGAEDEPDELIDRPAGSFDPACDGGALAAGERYAGSGAAGDIGCSDLCRMRILSHHGASPKPPRTTTFRRKASRPMNPLATSRTLELPFPAQDPSTATAPVHRRAGAEVRQRVIEVRHARARLQGANHHVVVLRARNLPHAADVRDRGGAPRRRRRRDRIHEPRRAPDLGVLRREPTNAEDRLRLAVELDDGAAHDVVAVLQDGQLPSEPVRPHQVVRVDAGHEGSARRGEAGVEGLLAAAVDRQAEHREALTEEEVRFGETLVVCRCHRPVDDDDHLVRLPRLPRDAEEHAAEPVRAITGVDRRQNPDRAHLRLRHRSRSCHRDLPLVRGAGNLRSPSRDRNRA